MFLPAVVLTSEYSTAQYQGRRTAASDTKDVRIEYSSRYSRFQFAVHKQLKMLKLSH